MFILGYNIRVYTTRVIDYCNDRHAYYRHALPNAGRRRAPKYQADRWTDDVTIAALLCRSDIALSVACRATSVHHCCALITRLQRALWVHRAKRGAASLYSNSAIGRAR